MICPQNNDIELQSPDLERTDNPTDTVRWRSCCLIMDKDFAIFFTKYFIIIGLISFFAVELHLSESCEDKNLFQSLLMLVIGVALPNPKLK